MGRVLKCKCYQFHTVVISIVIKIGTVEIQIAEGLKFLIEPTMLPEASGMHLKI